MKKKLWILLAAVSAVLLIGSFPARTLWGNGVCDVMRLAGYVLIGAATVLRFSGK